MRGHARSAPGRRHPGAYGGLATLLGLRSTARFTEVSVKSQIIGAMRMLGRGGLVGRTADLGALHAALRRARSGEAACILLTGAPGIGKTRLADEFVARCGDRVLALTARAHSLAGAHPFGLFVEALEGHLRQLPPAAVRRLCGGL